nr:MAG TPA: hypothetical protein [Caudoviricetes sp.]
MYMRANLLYQFVSKGILFFNSIICLVPLVNVNQDLFCDI